MKSLVPKPRALVALATVIALAAAVVSPAQAHRAAGPAHAGSGVLVYPDVGVAELWPRSLDPALTSDTQSLQAIALVYNGLVKLDGNNNVVPDLAAAMPTVSADRLTYTFKLRPNLMFSDGTPLTAQDVVYSITRCLSPKEKSPSSSPWSAGPR